MYQNTCSCVPQDDTPHDYQQAAGHRPVICLPAQHRRWGNYRFYLTFRSVLEPLIDARLMGLLFFLYST
jgi:hypothetical protein